MKMSKKKVFVVALAVCLLAITSVGTLAWFSASDSLTNDFHVATDENGKADFSVAVIEDAGNDGEENNDGGYTYDSILPGDVLKKDVKIKNTGAYDEYIRVIVEIDNAAAWREALGSDYRFENCFIGFDPTMWEEVNVNENIPGVDKIVIVAYYKNVLKCSPEEETEITLFTDVKIPEELTVDNANALGNSFTIKVKAHAIQSENIDELCGGSVWKAFNEVVNWNALSEYTTP